MRVAHASRRPTDFVLSEQRPLRAVRIYVREVLSGVNLRQMQIEILTGMGLGDCGYAFQICEDYVVYAYKNAVGRLETGICSRTRPVAQGAKDLEYLRAMAHAPETGEMRVRTGIGSNSGKPGVPISTERDGSRYRAVTNAAGDAAFAGLPPGTYTIHEELDGDLPDDPKVELHAKGCLDVTLLRTLRINGRLTTRSGEPPSGIEVQLRSTEDVPADGAIAGKGQPQRPKKAHGHKCWA